MWAGQSHNDQLNSFQGAFSATPLSFNSNSRPNTLEPNAASRRDGLHNPHRFPSSSSQGLRSRLLGHASVISSGTPSVEGNPAKRRAVEDGKTLDLPKPHMRSSKDRRPRLPPTLSGLHQPPPNAGLLPSISVDHPKNAHDDFPGPGRDNNLDPSPSEGEVQSQTPLEQPSKIDDSSKLYRRWSDEETVFLLKGVARFGIGSWTKILKCPDYSFGRRTAIDLKDRFRVCCPEQYSKTLQDSNISVSNGPSTQKVSRERSSRLHGADLVKLGIKKPFKKSSRRQRHAYTATEDEALLKGFHMHGKSWSRIRQEPALDLDRRTPTDLRDRMRTRYPDIYAAAGLKGRPEGFPANSHQAERDAAETQPTDSKTDKKQLTARPPMSNVNEKTASESKSTSLTRSSAASLLVSDPYLTLPFDDFEMDTEPITLDRGILDWALDKPGVGFDANRSSAIDPTTAGKPLPVSLPQQQAESTMRVPPASNSASLPSLATITGAGGNEFADEPFQSELPSFMQYFGSTLGIEDRTGSHTILSLEELLS